MISTLAPGKALARKEGSVSEEGELASEVWAETSPITTTIAWLSYGLEFWFHVISHYGRD